MNSEKSVELIGNYFGAACEWSAEHFGCTNGLGSAWQKCEETKKALHDYIVDLEDRQIKGCNATREELRELLGEPDNISVGTRKYKKPLIWKYKNTEYHFDDTPDEPNREGRVWLIYTETGLDYDPETIWKRKGVGSNEENS